MKVKVNNIMLSIPPYISTSWNHVEGLYMKGATLVVTLTGSESVNIPGISSEIIEMIFSAHADYLEQEVHQRPSLSKHEMSAFAGLPAGFPLLAQGFPMLSGADGSFQLGISSMDGLSSAMQHNPAHANAPDLPTEILQKIGAIVKIVAPEEMLTGTAAEQDCNCPFCQITRAINGDSSDEDEPHIFPEELLEGVNADSSQNPWKIQQTGENQYLVTSIGDRAEFQVFLGDPVGCTCGQEGCDHVIAVLKS